MKDEFAEKTNAPDNKNGADEKVIEAVPEVGEVSACVDGETPASNVVEVSATTIGEESERNSEVGEVAQTQDADKNAKPQKTNKESSYAAKMLGKSMAEKLKEALVSVLPISILVIILSLTLVKNVTVREVVTFAVSALFLILGIGFFNLGADLAMTPMGEQVGVGLTKSRKLSLLLPIAFVMGLLITVAEPDLSVLADQVRAVMNNVLLISTVGVGVGLFLVIAIARIVFKKDLSSMLIFFYMILFSLCAILIEQGKDSFIPLIFDSGGVTTGPITVPFIMALGIGVATTVGGRNSKENSFGLVALCSIGPMLAVLLLSIFAKGDMQYELPNYSVEASLGNFSGLLGDTVVEVVVALGLILAFFAVLQFTVLKLPKKKIARIAIGIVYTFVGLVIFLTAVKVGFMPMGFKLGVELAGVGNYVLIIFAFVLGFVVVLAEPAVHVLNQQVEDITAGAVSKRAMLVALSVGVGISIGLSIIRLIYGFSLLYYLIPGYILSLGLSFFVPKLYTAIAFDSGGVASGPLTSSFILPLAIGACTALRGEAQVLDFAFGIVAMVAMTPLITIQLLGFRAVTSAKVRERIVLKRIVDADDEQIIDFM